MLTRPRQSRSPPLALCNNLPRIYTSRSIRENRVSLYVKFCRAAGLWFYTPPKRAVLLSAFLVRSRFRRWKRDTKRNRVDYWYASYPRMDFRHVDISRSRSITIPQCSKKRETILRSAWNVKYRIGGGGPNDFLVPCVLIKASTRHGKNYNRFFFRASYHKDDSYNEVDGGKSQGDRSGFLLDDRGNKIVLRCISLRAD